MTETMIRALEALQAGGEPSGLSLQIHTLDAAQHGAYLGALIRLFGGGVPNRREVGDKIYCWHEWRRGDIVLHPPTPI